MPTPVKTCSRCSETRPFGEFYVHKRTGRHQGVCKECQRAAARARAAERQVEPAESKICSTCRQDKASHAFARDPRRADGMRASCKACAARAKWLERYGLTAEAYDALLAKQDGRCGICKRPAGDQRLHVDHCHDSDRVRGLLCGNCNRGIGCLGDDPARIRAAAAYVEGAW